MAAAVQRTAAKIAFITSFLLPLSEALEPGTAFGAPLGGVRAGPVQAHTVLQSARAKGIELGQGRLDLAQTKTKSNQIRNSENHLLSLIGLNCVSQKNADAEQPEAELKLSWKVKRKFLPTSS